jgi:putative ABC transport system substrate-binding protein
MAKPDGNVTGVSILATELDGKRQEILIEAVPGMRRMAALADRATTSTDRAKSLQEQASRQGVDLSLHWASRPDEISDAVDAAVRAQAQGINVLATPLLFNNRRVIMERVSVLRLPAMYQWPETAEEGGLLAYGPRFTDVYRQAAQLTAKLFGGTALGGIPVEQPTRFELVVNQRAARLMGLIFSPAILARADQLIE